MNIKALVRTLGKFVLVKLIPTFICPGYIVKSIMPKPRSYIRTRFNKNVYYIHNSKDLGEYVVHDGVYWVEEHRTPCEGKSNNVSLTEHDIIALKHARTNKVGGKKLYDRKEGTYIGNLHYDLRIKVNDKITSFVIEDIKFDNKAKLCILQPRHYGKDPYVIKKGYGKGVKRNSISGRCTMYIANNHIHVGFEGGYKCGYAFIQLDGNSYIMQPLNPKISHNGGKTKMKFLLFGRDNMEIERLIKDKDYVCSAKKDGTRFNIIHIHNKKDGYTYVNITSYKPDKNLWKQYYAQQGIKLEDAPRIQYNVKLGIFRIYDPDNKLGGLNISAEGWVKADTGTNPRINKRISGSDFTARECKATVYIYPHTVYGEYSPREKWNILMKLREYSGGIYKQLPHAYSEKAKRRLIRKCKKEKAVDGVVFYNLVTGESIKAKWAEDTRDGIIVGFQREIDKDGKYKNTCIPIVKVDKCELTMSGHINNNIKSDMYKNPDIYNGATVKYRCTEITKNGVPFQPVIESIEL